MNWSYSTRIDLGLPPAQPRDLAAAQRAIHDDLIDADGLCVAFGWWAWSGRLFDEAQQRAANDARRFPATEGSL